MKNNKKSMVETVVNEIIADDNIKLFTDQHKEAYVSASGDGRLVYNLDSQEAQDWLLSYVMDNFNNAVLVRDQPKSILESLRGFAKYRGQTKHLELRTSFDEDGNIWYDLGEYAVKITPNGWKTDICPPILFTRNYTQEPQVIPELGGSIWELFDFVNIKDPQDRLLLIAFLVASLVPEINKPILALSGPAGSGKSECTKTLKNLMDPTTPPSSPPITSTGGLDTLAQTSAVMAFDNLTTMKTKVANHFCCLATGYGVRIRKLYTNRYITFTAIRPLIINGISQVITQSDLLNRTIVVELSPIEKSVEDSTFRSQLDTARPRILGAMFDLLSRAMKIFPNIERKEWPRMGAFAKWGYAVTAALGGDYTGETFMDAYAKVEALQHSEALSANPFAEALVWYMQDIETWVGTAGELLNELQEASQNCVIKDIQYCSQSEYWPTNPRSARVQIQKALADLKSSGILAFLPSGSDRIICLVNAQLPLTKALYEAFSNVSFEGMTCAEQGYTLNDFVAKCNGAVSSEQVCYDNGPVLCDGVLRGKIKPRIISDDSDIKPDIGNMANFMEELIANQIPKTPKRLELEMKQRKRIELEREAEQKEKKARELEQREEQERRREEEKAKLAARKEKQAAYIASCKEANVEPDRKYIEYLEGGWDEIPF